jgi:hypothetical protein
MSAVMIVVLVLSIAILVGNTMIAIAFLRNRRKNMRTRRESEQDAMEELHRRVQDLTERRR